MIALVLWPAWEGSAPPGSRNRFCGRRWGHVGISARNRIRADLLDSRSAWSK